MGKLVPFSPRQEDLKVHLESALARAGEMFQRRLRAKEDLPKVLAALIEAGQADIALKAVVAWGNGETDPASLLEMCKAAAAVCGVSVGE